MSLITAIKNSLRRLFNPQTLYNERPETADPKHHDELQCRHCGHIHEEADESCSCGCTLTEI